MCRPKLWVRRLKADKMLQLSIISESLNGYAEKIQYNGSLFEKAE